MGERSAARCPPEGKLLDFGQGHRFALHDERIRCWLSLDQQAAAAAAAGRGHGGESASGPGYDGGAAAAEQSLGLLCDCCGVRVGQGENFVLGGILVVEGCDQRRYFVNCGLDRIDQDVAALGLHDDLRLPEHRVRVGAAIEVVERGGDALRVAFLYWDSLQRGVLAGALVPEVDRVLYLAHSSSGHTTISNMASSRARISTLSACVAWGVGAGVRPASRMPQPRGAAVCSERSTYWSRLSRWSEWAQ